MANTLFVFLLVVVIFFVLNDVVHSQGYISTFAGSSSNPVAPRGYLGDGGLASLSPPPFVPVLFWPSGVHIDAWSGNVIVSDNRNNRIRVIDKMSGNITTLAGNGYAGYTGDGGLAVNARLNTPTHVITDKVGNVIISDNVNSVIRRVNITTGIITTIAGTTIGSSGDGGLAISAQLNSPNGLSLYNDTLYIADTNNHKIRTVNLVTGLINTVAGIGTAGYNGDNMNATSSQLNAPTGVEVDSMGNLYIADRSNNRVRLVNSSGIISTIAGSSSSGNSGDGGLATLALLNSPYSLSFDSQSNLYISDNGNNKLRKISNGIISTTTSWNSPFGIDIDSNDNVYFAWYFSSLIACYNTTSGVSSTIAGTNGVRGYFGDGGPAVSTISYLPLLWYPQNAKIDPEGNVYIADANGARIRMVNSTTGTLSTVVSSLNFPMDVAIVNSSMFYIADKNNHRVKVSNNGVVTTVAGTGTAAYNGDGGLATNSNINAPISVGLDSVGNIYISTNGDHRIRLVNISTGIISTIAGTGTGGFNGDGISANLTQINSPVSIAVTPTGCVYIADKNNHRIRFLNATSGIISTIAGNGTASYGGDGGLAINANINSPQGVTFDMFGNVFIADTGNQVVRMVNGASGVISTIAGSGAYGYSGDGGLATSANLYDPVGVTISQNGELYITEYSNQIVRKVSFCNNRGKFVGSGCVCNTNSTYGGTWCQNPICYGLDSSDPTVCNGQGTCTSPNTCVCNSTFTGNQCQYPICNGTSSNTSTVCNSQGNCTSPDHCNCSSTFSGTFCQYPLCFGIPSTNNGVCNGRGICVGVDTCMCNSTFYGSNCSLTSCNGTLSNETSVCNGRGSCVAAETCVCQSGYGAFCQGNCDCSGHGVCSGVNACSCNVGYFGDRCEFNSCFGSSGETFGNGHKIFSTKGYLCKKINKYL